MSPRRSKPTARDERGEIASSLLRILLVFVLLGLVANEIGQMVITKVRVENAAAAGAQAGADSWAGVKNLPLAEAAALSGTRTADPTAAVSKFEVLPDGTAVLTASDEARTLFMQHIPFLKKFTVQQAKQSEKHSA